MDVSAGDTHTMYLKEDGTVRSVGDNGSGRLGMELQPKEVILLQVLDANRQSIQWSCRNFIGWFTYHVSKGRWNRLDGWKQF